jgi:phosphoglycolate phosphatase
MIKQVFFDWNGTILNDATANLKAENYSLSLFNIKPITIKKFRDTFEIPITKYYAKVGISEKVFFENHAKIQETYHSFYEKQIEHCKAREGTEILLKWLYSKGIKSVILSNHTEEGIEKHLKRLKLEKYIETLLANNSIMHTGLKDKAQRAESYIEKNNVSPKQILVVGDAPEEAKIARQIGAKSALVSGGWYSETRLKEAKPDYIIERLDELIGVINKIQ